jgi:hypothetical protein
METLHALLGVDGLLEPSSSEFFLEVLLPRVVVMVRLGGVMPRPAMAEKVGVSVALAFTHPAEPTTV